MGKTKRPMVEKTQRVAINQVTGEMEVTILDDVQKAFERCWETIDGQMLKLSNAENLRLVAKLHEMLQGMVPHT